MSAFFGLHIGNTSACLAVSRDGRSDVVANAAGDRVTPAVVAWSDNEVMVGAAAKQFATRNPRNVVLRANKSLIGKSIDDPIVQNLASKSGKDCSLILTDGKTPFYEIEIDEKKQRISPTIVLTHVLKNMFEIALSHATDNEVRTVVTVPHDCENIREEVAKCAKKAGFQILQLISEPASSLLAYGISQIDHSESSFCLVYRVGGQTMDCTIVRINSGFITIEAVVEKRIGGEKVTETLASFLAQEFQRKYKADPRETKKGTQKLMIHAENIKHVLSTLDSSSCYIESLYEGIDFSANVTRARMENELAAILPDFISPVHDVMKTCGIASKQVDRIIFAGGTTKIPKIQKSVKAIFRDNIEVLNSLNPDEVLAIGAATQAALLGDEWKGPVRPELKALNGVILLTLDDDNEEDVILVAKGTPIPVRKSYHMDKIAKDSVTARVFLKMDDGRKITLAELTLKDLSPDSAKISVSAHIHREGSTHVCLTDKVGGKVEQVTLNF